MKGGKIMSLHDFTGLYAVILILFAIVAGIELGAIALTADYYLPIGKKYAINMRNLLILVMLLIIATGVMVIHFFAYSLISSTAVYIMFAIIGIIEAVILIRLVLPFLVIRKPLN